MRRTPVVGDPKTERVGKSSRIALRGSVAQQTDVVVPRAS
jgi:hypothetical protein